MHFSLSTARRKRRTHTYRRYAMSLSENLNDCTSRRTCRQHHTPPTPTTSQQQSTHITALESDGQGGSPRHTPCCDYSARRTSSNPAKIVNSPLKGFFRKNTSNTAWSRWRPPFQYAYAMVNCEAGHNTLHANRFEEQGEAAAQLDHLNSYVNPDADGSPPRAPQSTAAINEPAA